MTYKTYMNPDIQIFDRNRKKLHFNRAAGNFEKADFLFNEVSNRIADQFNFLIKKKFNKALIIGTKNGFLSENLKQNNIIEKVYETDFSMQFLNNKNPKNLINCDEEFLPFKNESFDLILSNLNLHWVNDLPGCLAQIKRILKKDGFFQATLFGSKTLMELRQALMEAEIENGGYSQRISPFIDVKEGAALVQRASFKEPVSIAEEIDVKYDNILELLKDIKNMGEANSLTKANKTTPKKNYFFKAAEIYSNKFSDDNNQLNAKFEIINISGWR